MSEASTPLHEELPSSPTGLHFRSFQATMLLSIMQTVFVAALAVVPLFTVATPVGLGEARLNLRASSHTGDATFYTPELGACGKINSESQLVAGVASPVFKKFPGAGANPNKNPICGKKARVQYGRKSVDVMVVDSCPGCGDSGIDLSPAAFKRLAPLSKGRLPGTKWTIL